MKPKIKFAAIALSCALLGLVIVGVGIPQKTEVDRLYHCTSNLAGQPDADVLLKGIYYRYFLRDDHFIGTINVVGYRECTRDYTFKGDAESYFTDEAGQPHGSIRQHGIFTQLSVAENDYSLTYTAAKAPAL